MKRFVDSVQGFAGETETDRRCWIEVFEDLELEFGWDGDECRRRGGRFFLGFVFCEVVRDEVGEGEQ